MPSTREDTIANFAPISTSAFNSVGRDLISTLWIILMKQ